MIIRDSRIEFLDTRFYLTESGAYLPSVTTILDCYPKGAQFYEWLKKVGENSDEIRDEAGRKGSVVHQLTEKYDKGEGVAILDEFGNPQYRIIEWAMFERYIEFRNRYPDFKILHIELNMVSENLGFAGTLDRVFEYQGKKVLVDLKTSGALHDHFWLQQAAYAELLKERGVTIDQTAILWLNAKTRTDGKNGAIQGQGWQMVFQDQPHEHLYDLFLSTKKLFDATKGSLKPNLKSYNIFHQLNNTNGLI